MKKTTWLMGLLSLCGVFSSSVFAMDLYEDDPNLNPVAFPTEPEQPLSSCPCPGSSLNLSGYLNAGYYGNTYGADYNGNANSNSQNIGALNALYLSAQKAAETGGCGVDWGFGTDFMFGEDARFMRVQNGLDEKWVTGHNRRGDDTYGYAMPQLYGELAVNNLSAKVGHFYTPFGYEGAKATDRFFYTRGLSFDSLPVTHTGVWATYSGLEKISFSAGWFNGIDQGFSNKDKGSLVAGQVAITPSDKLSLTYTFGTGDISQTEDDENLLGVLTDEHVKGTIHTWVLKFTPNECWTFVTTADYQNVDIDSETVVVYPGSIPVVTRNGYSSYVLGQHIYRNINACWKLGARAEWASVKSDLPDMQVAGKDRVDKVAVSVGPNWSPRGNELMTIRPEFRYDHNDEAGYGKLDDKVDQISLGVDLLAKF